jgi:hypothetical protein
VTFLPYLCLFKGICDKTDAYMVLVGKSEGKRTSGYRWERNIEVALQEIGWQGVDWIYLAQR